MKFPILFLVVLLFGSTAGCKKKQERGSAGLGIGSDALMAGAGAKTDTEEGNPAGAEPSPDENLNSDALPRHAAQLEKPTPAAPLASAEPRQTAGTFSVGELLGKIRETDIFSWHPLIAQIEKQGGKDELIELFVGMVRQDDSRASTARSFLEEWNVPVRFAKAKPGGNEHSKLHWAKAEIADGDLAVSWSLDFADEIYESIAAPQGSFPLRANYEVYVEGGTLQKRITRKFDAKNGQNEHSVVLARDLGPGKYEVSFYLHAQFLDDGQPYSTNITLGYMSIEN